MKWFVHILYAALAYRMVAPTDVAFALAAIGTVLTDLSGHTGLRRNKYHDLGALLYHTVAAVLYSTTPAAAAAGLAAGITHIVLDLVSPGKLAVNWAYNLAWSTPAVWLWTHFI